MTKIHSSVNAGSNHLHEYVAAILMDLSKAFDCLPHDLLLSKLSAYGLSKKATTLLGSYLKDRKQQVRLGPNKSNWTGIIKGVPQGSILGPLLFNVFLNDIFYFVNKASLFNYADDNTLSHHHSDPTILKEILEQESMSLILWFQNNLMKANPDKFQAISLGKKSFETIKSFDIGNFEIQCEEKAQLLGINIDYLLKFDVHISELCRKASRQLSVLKRIGHNLTQQAKLVIYKSFIASNFNYCPLVWHFCNKTSTNKLERIQERAIRFVYNDFKTPVNVLLNKAGLEHLHIRRIKNLASESFKIINKLSPTILQDLVSEKQLPYSLRRSCTAELPRVNTTQYGLKSFRYEASRIWNSLPNDLRKAESYDTFLRMIRHWKGPLCSCSICET
jgi:ribonuclease P/MRP protein subunit RPP40